MTTATAIRPTDEQILPVLSRDAISALSAADITPAGWARRHFGCDQWRGDKCGCTDDRCIGYHHEAGDECGCLPVLLAEME